MKNQISRAIFLLVLLVLTACVNEIPPLVEETKSPSQTSAATQIVFDAAYYDGIIVITQYYTFLGHGLHEEAYWLLSVPEQNYHNLDEYVEDTRLAFKTVEIISIQPYFAAVKEQGGQITPDPSNKKRFVVQIRAWGEGNMSGSVMNGTLQTLFLTLVLEDGRWKIDSFATGPVLPTVDPSASQTPEPESILDIGYIWN